MNEVDAVMEKIEAMRTGVIDVLADNRATPEEAMTLLSGLLLMVYHQVVNDKSRENFVNVMTQCYDTLVLMTEEPEGSVH